MTIYLVFVDDFGTRHNEIWRGTQKDAYEEMHRRNEAIENRGLDDYGYWYVSDQDSFKPAE